MGLKYRKIVFKYFLNTLKSVSKYIRFGKGPGGPLFIGYNSWPGVFLLGASERTGRFFTQLLFHDPISVSL